MTSSETGSHGTNSSPEPPCISPLLVAVATAAAADIAAGGTGLPETNPGQSKPKDEVDNVDPDTDLTNSDDLNSASPYSTSVHNIGTVLPVLPRTYDFDNINRWVSDNHYRRLMEMNNIPRDPAKWNSTQVSNSEHYLVAFKFSMNFNVDEACMFVKFSVLLLHHLRFVFSVLVLGTSRLFSTIFVSLESSY